MKKIKVSLKGPFLPTIGGVSVHVSRLAEILSKEDLISCVYNTSGFEKIKTNCFKVIPVFYKHARYTITHSMLWYLLHGIRDRSDIIHMHGNPIWETPSIYFLLLQKKKLVYTIHDQMMLSNLNKFPKLLAYLFSKILCNRNIYWITVSSNIKYQLEIINRNCTNISVIPAYIQSISDETPLNFEIENFIKTRSRIISIYANSTRIYNGKDLYGIDITLKAIPAIKAVFPSVGLIISLPGEVILDQLNYYKKIINECQIENNVLIFLEPINNPLNLWKRSNIVLRPTLTDGDSLVIREALSQGTFVIASDSVARTENVILFKSEDVVDLSNKVIEVLSDKVPIISESTFSNYELIKSIYYNLYFGKHIE